MGRLRRLEHALGQNARPWEVVVFFWLPLTVLGVVAFAELRWGRSLGDFTIFRNAARDLMHGASPYVAADPGRLANNDAFVYPPVTGFAYVPFAVLPIEAARVAILTGGALAVVLALRLVGVRDWRCYGLAIGTAPVLDGVSIGALTPFLVLGAAVAWRLRDRPLGGGLAVGATAVAKLFLWPLLVWLAVTRRAGAALVAGAAAVVLAVAGWAAIGFAGLRPYPHLLRVLADVEAGQSYSLAGLLHLTGRAGSVFGILVAAAVATAIAVAARRSPNEALPFALAIAGSLLATPVLWVHYFALLLVPLGILRPRLSAAWLALLGFWVTPLAHSDGVTWRALFALLLASAIVADLLVARTRADGTVLTAPSQARA